MDRLKAKVAYLEQEKQHTYEILSTQDSKLEGLQQAEIVTYTNYLKQQINSLSVQQIRDLDTNKSFDKLSSANIIDMNMLLQENLSLRQNMSDP